MSTGKTNSQGKALPALTTPAAVSNVLSGKEYIDSNGVKQTGAMTNMGSLSGTITTKTQTISGSTGYYSSVSAEISTAERNKIIASNIRSGVSILGTAGSYTGNFASGSGVLNLAPNTGGYISASGIGFLPQAIFAGIQYTFQNMYGALEVRSSFISYCPYMAESGFTMNPNIYGNTNSGFMDTKVYNGGSGIWTVNNGSFTAFVFNSYTGNEGITFSWYAW